MNILKAIRAAMIPAYWKGLIRAMVPTIEHAEAFEGLEFASIVDVGGNIGQFSLFAAHRWPGATIHAFEPLPDQAARFEAVHGKRVTLHRCALGEDKRMLPIHVASRKDSSSLLPLGEMQKAMFAMDEVAQIDVPVDRLDAVLSAANLPAPALLKIDVQGFEFEVLRGAGELLRHFSHIYVEASFVELYQGQRLFPDIEAVLREYGFAHVKTLNIARDRLGKEVQADLLYAREVGIVA